MRRRPLASQLCTCQTMAKHNEDCIWETPFHPSQWQSQRLPALRRRNSPFHQGEGGGGELWAHYITLHLFSIYIWAHCYDEKSTSPPVQHIKSGPCQSSQPHKALTRRSAGSAGRSPPPAARTARTSPAWSFARPGVQPCSKRNGAARMAGRRRRRKHSRTRTCKSEWIPSTEAFLQDLLTPFHAGP
jgi:hypothetical protein